MEEVEAVVVMVAGQIGERGFSPWWMLSGTFMKKQRSFSAR